MGNESPENMTPFEEREIRGVSTKALITIIVSTASIVATVLGVYYSLAAKIQELHSSGVSNERILDLRIQTIQSQINSQQTQIDYLRTKIEGSHKE